MIRSQLCDILGIEKPIFQGGMAWIADANLAAAVSNAGGLGLISSINAGTEAVRAEIRKARTLTRKPFGVNIMLAAPNAAEIANLVVEEGVTIVTTGAGSPAPYMERWLAAGIRVIPVVASVAYALKMEELGATAVIAEGFPCWQPAASPTVAVRRPPLCWAPAAYKWAPASWWPTNAAYTPPTRSASSRHRT